MQKLPLKNPRVLSIIAVVSIGMLMLSFAATRINTRDVTEVLQKTGLIGSISRPPSKSDPVTQHFDKLKEYAIKEGILNTRVAADDGSITGTPELKPDEIKQLNQLDDKMRKDGTTYINAEAISLWFENFPTDRYTPEERKTKAKEYMDALREKISKGELTMEQAGKQIENDESLNDIDTAWKSNAYFKVEYAKKDLYTFLDDDIEAKFWQMKAGDLSEVLVGRKMDIDGKPEGVYMIIKVNQREDKEFETYQEFIQQQ